MRFNFLTTIIISAFAFASLANVPDGIIITGPSIVAANSHDVNYVATIVAAVGDYESYFWKCYDENWNEIDLFASYAFHKSIRLNVGTNNFYLWVEAKYTRNGLPGTNIVRAVTSLIRNEVPVFSSQTSPGIHNGQYDYGNTTVIHMNIDDDDNSGDGLDEYNYEDTGEDYLQQDEKYFFDDDLLPIELDVEGYMEDIDPRFIDLIFDVPNNISVWLKVNDNYFTNIAPCGVITTNHCYRIPLLGRTLNYPLYVEGIAPGMGTLKIFYNQNDDEDFNTLVYSNRFRTCASLYGRQPFSVYHSGPKEVYYCANITNGLTNCEWSLIDDVDDTYNAPSFAVDPFFYRYNGAHFITKTYKSGCVGTTPYLYNGKLYVSFDAFGDGDTIVTSDDVDAFFTNSGWSNKLVRGPFIDSMVLFYALPNEYLWSACRLTNYDPGIYHTFWQMFILKANHLYKLIHRGEALYEYSQSLDNEEREIHPAIFIPDFDL